MFVLTSIIKNDNKVIIAIITYGIHINFKAPCLAFKIIISFTTTYNNHKKKKKNKGILTDKEMEVQRR